MICEHCRQRIEPGQPAQAWIPLGAFTHAKLTDCPVAVAALAELQGQDSHRGGRNA